MLSSQFLLNFFSSFFGRIFKVICKLFLCLNSLRTEEDQRVTFRRYTYNYSSLMENNTVRPRYLGFWKFVFEWRAGCVYHQLNNAIWMYPGVNIDTGNRWHWLHANQPMRGESTDSHHDPSAKETARSAGNGKRGGNWKCDGQRGWGDRWRHRIYI